eukprot:2738701-Alexandrium_andersonii.AAC.1
MVVVSRRALFAPVAVAFSHPCAAASAGHRGEGRARAAGAPGVRAGPRAAAAPVRFCPRRG